jgi:hypothetical protein
VKKSRRIKREPNEEEVEGFDQEIPEKETTNGRLMKRIKPQMNRVRNIDNTGLGLFLFVFFLIFEDFWIIFCVKDVPDFTDLSNYVKAVVQSNSKLQTDLSAEAEDMEALFGPYIGADPFFGWERTFEIRYEKMEPFAGKYRFKYLFSHFLVLLFHDG